MKKKRRKKFRKIWAEWENEFLILLQSFHLCNLSKIFFFVSSCSYVRNSPAIWQYAVSHQHLFYIKPHINVCAFVLQRSVDLKVGSHVISFYSPLVFIIFYALCCFILLCIFSKRSGLSSLNLTVSKVKALVKESWIKNKFILLGG